MEHLDIFDFLSHITTVPGTSGYEAPVAGEFARAFAPYCDEVRIIEHTGTVIARRRGAGPKVMLCAHIDEVGLMTMGTEKDGSVRFLSMGVAAQTLPAQEVTILAPDGPIYGVIGAMPPHLTAGDHSRVTPADELFIDTGLAPEEAMRRIPAGLPVQLTGRTTRLQNERVASKTLDDRACAAILLDCAQRLARRAHDADVYFVLVAREERDSFGAMTATETIRPDLAIILDVTHGTMPGCADGETHPIDETVLSIGPNLHRKLTDHVLKTAGELGVTTRIEAEAGNTYTDAWAVQVAAEGVPCALISLPIKYMHTTVELGSMALMREQARLLCETICEMETGWEETLCY